MKTSRVRRSSAPPASSASAAPAPDAHSSTRLLFLPLALGLALASFAFLPRIQSNPRLLKSFVVAGAGLFVWWTLVWWKARGRGVRLDRLLRPEHYMQTAAQLSIYVYWGFYW